MADNDQAGAAPESSSIADRIADAFLGKEPDEPQAPAEPEQQAAEPEADPVAEPEAAASEESPSTAESEFAEVEFNGTKYQVPPELREPLIKSADYTRKTQEVAEQRRLVEYQTQQLKIAESERKFAETVKDEIQQLGALDAQINQYKQLDWSSLTSDDMIRHKLAMDNLRDQREALDRTLGKKHGQFQEELKRSHAELVAKGTEAIKKSIPNFSAETAKEITAAAVADGYTAEEVASILDPRMVKTLWKAAQFDKLQAAKTQTVQKVAQAKPIAKATPASRPMDQAARERIDYSKQMKAAKTSAEKARIIQRRLESTF